MAYQGEEKKRYQREWVANRRAEYLADKVCASCSSKGSLELDHINPSSKKYNPASLWGMAKDNPRRVAELAKCQVLCNSCHKKKSKEWHEKNRSHGRSRYSYGCRCEVCVEAKRLHNRQRYAAKA